MNTAAKALVEKSKIQQQDRVKLEVAETTSLNTYLNIEKMFSNYIFVKGLTFKTCSEFI